MKIEDLGHLEYRAAWSVQEEAHAQVLRGDEERILLVEHPPVITFGRREGGEKHLVASEDRLRTLGVQVVKSDRGGDITFHGPGQIVAYPIVRLNDHRFSVGRYVHALEAAVATTLRRLGVVTQTDPSAVGVWAVDGGEPAKVCAIGVRIRRGVSLHGVALNVSTDLRYFDLIVPCGLAGRRATSVERLLGDGAPSVGTIKAMLAGDLLTTLSESGVK